AAGMGYERVRELVAALVRVGIRAPRRAEQTDTEIAAVTAVAVLRVRQHRNAVAVLGQIGEAVSCPPVPPALLPPPLVPPARRVPRGVRRRREVRWALRVAELHLVGRGRRAPRERKADLEQRVLLVPVDRRVELDSPRLGVEADDLDEAARLAERPLESNLAA